MRVLVICDDYYHPAHVIREGLANWREPGLQFDWLESAEEWSPERMGQYPVVLMAKSDNVTAADRRPWMTDEVQTGFRAYASAGGGILFVHSGTVCKDLPTQRAVVGGAFLNHPKQCPVTVEPNDGHPLARQAEPFTVVDEHYQMALDDRQADVFLTTSSEHGSQPGGWTRAEGAGRVCVLTPGHNVEVWQHPSFQTLLRNALSWCAGATSA